MQDCIAAVATAPGTGGIAVIRLSGEDSLKIARKMFSPAKQKQEFIANRMYPGKIDGAGFTDYGYMVWFKAPNSFTGEDIVELHCHGGVQLTRGILARCVELGARPAERGEFTKRAFLNGKLSLASAEGMIDMINAESSAMLRAGCMMYGEKLTGEVEILQNGLKELLAAISVEIDYPEEDADGLDLIGIKDKIRSLNEGISRLAGSYSVGKKIRDGVTVAICGRPNTGKSSLLNALLGYDKAIVSPEEGTTRDAVEGILEIDGVKFNLIDTAGIRDRAGAVESIGIERARSAVKSADVIIAVTDGGDYVLPDGIGGKVIKVFNKCDVKVPCGDYDAAVSAKTGEGLGLLKKVLSSYGVCETSLDAAYIIEERHFTALKRASASLESAVSNMELFTPDIIVVDVKDAWEALGEITGETASEEIIDTIFKKFCVGK